MFSSGRTWKDKVSLRGVEGDVSALAQEGSSLDMGTTYPEVDPQPWLLSRFSFPFLSGPAHLGEGLGGMSFPFRSGRTSEAVVWGDGSLLYVVSLASLVLDLAFFPIFQSILHPAPSGL